MRVDRWTRRNWMGLAAAAGAAFANNGCCTAVLAAIEGADSDVESAKREGNLTAVKQYEKEAERLRDVAVPVCRIVTSLLAGSGRGPGLLAPEGFRQTSIETTPLGPGTVIAASTAPSPHDPAVLRDYLLDVLSDERILVYDDALGVVGSIILAEGLVGAPFQNSQGLAVTPDGATILTTATGSPPHIAFSDAATLTVRGRLELPAGLFPGAVATAPGGRRAYVGAVEGGGPFEAPDGLLLEIDIDEMAISRRIVLPKLSSNSVDNYRDIVVSPDGGQVFVLDRSARGLHIVDARSANLTATVPTIGGPRRLAVHPDGDRVYAFPAFVGGSFDFDGIWEINTTIAAKTGEIVLPARSTQGSVFDLAISPAGERLFASALDYPSVWHIDTYTREVVDSSDFGTDVTHLMFR